MGSKINLDDVYPHIGAFGPYQKKLFILSGLPAITTAFQMLYWVFAAPPVPHRCVLPQEENLTHINFTLPTDVWNVSYPIDPVTGTYSQCEYLDGKQEVTCHKYVYDLSSYSSSILMTWDIVCQRAWLAALSMSLYMAGVLIGSLLYGIVSDSYGRKITFYIALVVEVVAGALSALTSDFTTFLVLRFLVGTSSPGIFNCLYCLALEFVGSEKRMTIGTCYMFFFTAGYLLTPAFGYFIGNWRAFLMVVSLVGILYLPYWWIIPESPRWLISKGRISEAELTLKKICKSNGTKLPDNWLRIVSSEDQSASIKSMQSIIFLCGSSKLRLRTINLCFNWFVNSAVYYGLSLNTSNLGGDPYVNALLAGAVEIPAYSFVLLVLNRLGRKKPLFLCMMTAGLSLLLTTMFNRDVAWIQIMLCMIGKLAITSSFGIIYLFTAELYPTGIRNVAVGTGSMFARLGGIVAPTINLLDQIWISAPLLVFGILSCTAALLALLMPDTLNKKLPETLEEAEAIEKKMATS